MKKKYDNSYNRVNDAKFFDYENYLKYKNDIWNPKYQEGLYFSALEEIGQSLNINIGLKKKSDNNIQWFKTLHALHDGHSALKTLAKEQDFDLSLPVFKKTPVLNPLKSIMAAFKSTPSQKHSFLEQSEKDNSTNFHYIRLSFSSIDSKYSQTAIIAKIVCQTLMKQITNNTISRWMIPVRLEEASSIQASYIGLQIEENQSIQEVHKNLVEKLKKQEYWGYHLISKLGLKLGRRAIQFLTEKNVLKDETIWMGLVSNLGDLGLSKELDELTVLVPVRWHRPLGVVTYKHNGQQIITITFHDSLKKVNVNEISREITELRSAL